MAEPEDGQSGYLAWWNGTKWQFKSNDTGNVWRDANAVRIAKCVFTSGSLTRLCFTGCRLLNKQEYATKSSLSGKQDTLVSGTNIKTIGGKSILGSGDIPQSGEMPIGLVIQAMSTSSYVPDGCLPCDGSEYTKAQFPDLWNNYLTTTEVISKTWYAWTFDDGDSTYTVYTESATPSIGDSVYRFDSAGASYVAYSITAVGSGTITVNYRTGLECPRNSAADTTTTSSAPTKLNTCSYTDYSADITTYGQCGKFAVDTTNQKFKAPLIKDGSYITQAMSNSELGKAYNESLPQHTHTITSSHALFLGNAAGGWGNNLDATGQTNTTGGASSSTYQDGAKVQGDNVRMRFFVVVANGQINQSVMDWSQWVIGLSVKANTDLSNMNPTSTAKETIVGWSMPDYTAKIETQETTYTAPSKGWVYVMTQGNELKVSINGSQLAHGRSGIYYNVCYSLAYMVNTGDVVTVTGMDTAKETPLIAFYPCKGVSSSGGG